MGVRLPYPVTVEYNKPTMANVQLRLLGHASMQGEGGWQVWRAEKPYQLLSYLAYQADWVSREQVAFLFWPDRTTEAAKSNLRKVIYRVRQLNLTRLEVDRQKLRWLVETDTGAFQKAVEEADWSSAVGLYGGPFLVGLEADDSSEFSDWLAFERERLHSLWREALLKHSHILAEQHRYDEASNLLTPLIQQDSLDEEALGLYMTMLAGAGKQVQALRAFDSFEQNLADELGLEPTSEMRHLAKVVRNSELAHHPLGVESAASAVTRSHVGIVTKPERALPQSPTPFVGRDFELAEISHLLSQPTCRLLTLLGSGGIGKSRLALQAAHEQSERYTQVAFVPLAALDDPSRIPSTVADALGLELTGQDTPSNQLARHIGREQMLIVLDNYEHLVSGASVASELLLHCPGLNLLITSRERLNLQEEWLFQLDGMAYPKEEVSLETARAYDALQLFEQRARRMQPRFALGEDNLGAILEICRFVAGAPLGLELAAAWVRMLSCEEIVDELSRNLDFLEGEQNLADRHQSLRATFEHSWQLLSPREQLALAKLSVFKAGFTKEAANAIADIPLPVIASLVDKSLLRRRDGRFDSHSLVYQYSREKLGASQETSELEQRHSAYFLRLLNRHSEEPTADPKALLTNLEPELENIHLASRTAVRLQNFRPLETAILVLKKVYTTGARFVEGDRVFQDLAENLNEHTANAETLRAHLLTGRAEFAYYLSRYSEGVRFAEQAVALLGAKKQTQHLIQPLTFLAATTMELGNYTEAREYFKRALTLTQKLEHPSLQSGIGNLAIIEDIMGNYSAAEELYQEAVALARQQKNVIDLATQLNNYGCFLTNIGKADKAVPYLEEALEAVRAQGIPYEQDVILSSLAKACLELKVFEQTRAYALQALEIAKANQHHLIEDEAIFTLGRASLAQAEYSDAEASFLEALRRAWAQRRLRTVLTILLSVAELYLLRDQVEQAVTYLYLVKSHASTERVDRDRAEHLLESIPTATGTSTLDEEQVDLTEAINALIGEAND